MSTTPNPETLLTLDDCVDEVLGLLTGLDLTYAADLDRYRAITRQLNRALRANALEKEWSWYSSVQSVGTASQGDTQVWLSSSVRPRIINDDAVRFVNDDGVPVMWAYFLPRDALHKYQGQRGMWCSVTRNEITFSRPFDSGLEGMDIQVPVMREPIMFRLPSLPDNPNTAPPAIDPAVRAQPLDFWYPDVVVLRAAFLYAQADPVMQPRVQTLEAQYKDLMYQIIEREDRNTDTPYMNDFFVPVRSGLNDLSGPHLHPHAADRR